MQRKFLILLVGLLFSFSVAKENNSNISASGTSNKVYHQTTVAQQAGAAYDLGTSVFFPVYAKNGMVVSEHELASKVGLDILKDGGNAIDAAVGIAFALAVVLPNAGNIGGGGFMLAYDQKNQKVRAIDFREVAPMNANKDSFLSEDGAVIDGKSINTHYASGVPGTVAGLEYAWRQGGALPWNKLIEPAIELADSGFEVSPALEKKLSGSANFLGKWDSTRKIFFKNGQPLKNGDWLIQKDLAKSLRLIAKQGAKAFYEGDIADKIVAEMAPYHWITKQDLSSYKVIERDPIWGTYKGYKVAIMPPPSSGGIHIIQILNILERWPLYQWGQNSAQTIHYMVEAMKLAYADRQKYLGDPDFVSMPVKGLVSKRYADELSKKITAKASKVSTVNPGNPFPYESEETTHFSVIDKEGNAVSVTYTLNGNFGNGIVVKGTGILLNNEMDDFALKPGVANIYGLMGNEANQVAPGKRPLSSMSPTFVFYNNQLHLVTGSPGGARIITTVLQMILNDIEFKLNPAEATAAARVHHQLLPNELRVEKPLSVDTINLLKKRGHKVVIKPSMGKTQTIKVNPNGLLEGASDTRNPDGKVMGY
ncbi:MAG: gamma-glutamyltransferase [Neisseriaceae bacterium]|nr:MAG: gamma-glutamyltransferase [Neisseriaceae bacterium]